MGNHCVEVCCLLANLLYLLIFLASELFGISFQHEGLFVELWRCCIPQVLAVFWLPQVAYIINSIATPSTSEIIPNTLYLGNAVAAPTPKLFADLDITLVLELGDDTRKNDPANVRAVLLQLKCSDAVGSDLNIMGIAPQAVAFMDEAIMKEDRRKARLLVHCSAGVSRSPAIVVHWLVGSKKAKSVDERVWFVQKARPVVDIIAVIISLQ
jgi:protein-tyrosine phosphatase